jgi:hypothetical protein
MKFVKWEGDNAIFRKATLFDLLKHWFLPLGKNNIIVDMDEWDNTLENLTEELK